MNHHTNYQKLNLTEGIAVLIAIIGVSLISLLGYNALSSEQKSLALSGFEIFDMHNQLAHEAEAIKRLTWDGPQEFMNQFYLAFTQTMTLPQEEMAWWQTFGQQTKVALNSFGEFSEQIAIQYQTLNQPQIISSPQGEVAGISITAKEKDYVGSEVLDNIVPPGVKPDIVPINFSPPPEIDLQLLIQKLPKLTN